MLIIDCEYWPDSLNNTIRQERGQAAYGLKKLNLSLKPGLKSKNSLISIVICGKTTIECIPLKFDNKGSIIHLIFSSYSISVIFTPKFFYGSP